MSILVFEIVLLFETQDVFIDKNFFFIVKMMVFKKANKIFTLENISSLVILIDYKITLVFQNPNSLECLKISLLH